VTAVTWVRWWLPDSTLSAVESLSSVLATVVRSLSGWGLASVLVPVLEPRRSDSSLAVLSAHQEPRAGGHLA
jgi:NADH:ubiquinone oxidoreductase subunit 4 (subunit M)